MYVDIIQIMLFFHTFSSQGIMEYLGLVDRIWFGDELNSISVYPAKNQKMTFISR